MLLVQIALTQKIAIKISKRLPDEVVLVALHVFFMLIADI